MEAVSPRLVLAAVALAVMVAIPPESAKAVEGAAFRASTVVWALGDGADGSRPARRLARFVARRRPDRFFYLGDVYERGTRADFRRKYSPLYGRLAWRTDPVLGNREYTNRKRGYYPYWRAARGWPRTRARHRAYVDRSGWQVLAYSSEDNPRSEARWLRRRMRGHRGTCRVAIAHRGRYMVADEGHGNYSSQEPVWNVLKRRTAINLVAHHHLYGRLAPIDGVHVFVSGAGGHDLREMGEQQQEVEESETGEPIALRLVLRRGSARFTALDASGEVHDRGIIRCRPLR